MDALLRADPVVPQRFLIVETGQPLPALRRHGGFPHWIRVAAGLAERDTATVDVEAGETLPAADGFAGVIVTGSGAMVSDRLDWSERTAAWLAEVARAGIPVLGICYGHQLLAHALGGEVGDHPGGREMGTFEIVLEDAARDDAVLGPLPSRFDAQLTHVQSVLRLPDGATVLARSAHEPVQAFRWGEAAWGVQFHPEFSATHMRGYIRARRVALMREGQDPDALSKAVGAAPQGRRVLKRFVHVAREARA
ncbi:glutamine amidotransferase [Lysobacter sp. SG-8]|uniref:Glutamine amidotransferase n=1 Tax=Marilutibacter penaei TaxID=2759900 RepID=A0A7W3U4P0_9GAMM|nr:glutamine amidotransferase [Lysobacter penaei]MBB1088813.1 glutamine amidotransferase [Lysobacter penaei]